MKKVMKRRAFGLLGGTCLATAAAARPTLAQSSASDPALLTTSLTPFGGERAGNADGSIPAWTGGWVEPPLGPDQPTGVPLNWTDAALYTVDASNLSKHQNLVTPGLQAMITKFGFSLTVYPTHRTAAAPQYVYENIAKNVTRAKFDPAGGRFGFTGGYAGIPFPIIDTSDPQTAGTQLIWNHLAHFEGFSKHLTYCPAIVCQGGSQVVTNVLLTRLQYPYYDPDGSVETYAGYYSKLNITTIAPANTEGQETLVWHSTNLNTVSDITWTLLNGEARVRKAPNEAYDTPNPTYNGISNVDESQCFYGNPHKYDWTYIGKQEMLVPYNNNAVQYQNALDFCSPKFPNPEMLRWEKHRVWVVEANLHPGERNVLLKRRFYIDEDTGQSLLGEAYDHDSNLTRAYMVPVRVVPSIPMVNPVGIVVFSLETGDYVVNANFGIPPNVCLEYSGPQPSSDFEAQAMAASSSF